MIKQTLPKDLLRSFPFLNFFTRQINQLCVLLDACGKVTYCHYQFSHDQPHLANELPGKSIFDYYQLPEKKTLNEVFSNSKVICPELRDLTWEMMDANPINRIFTIFPSSPLCDKFVSYPNFHSKFPQSSLFMMKIDEINFLGIITFTGFQSPVSMFGSGVVIITDLDGRIVAHNQALLDILKDGKPVIDRPLKDLFKLESESAETEWKDLPLNPMPLKASDVSFSSKEVFLFDKSGLAWRSRISDSMGFVHINIPLNHDHCDYQFSFKASFADNAFPCLILRAEDKNPPDNFGYLFGPRGSEPSLILKQCGVELKNIQAPDMRGLTESQFSLEKRDNRIIFSVNGIPRINYLEEFPLPAVPRNHIAFLVRPGTVCAVREMRLFLSKPGGRPVPPVFAVPENGLRCKFRVHREPFDLRARGFYAYRLENITSYEKRIVQLKSERDTFQDSLRMREEMTAYIGLNARVVQIKESLQILSQSASGILLAGETGTGKEVLARLFHKLTGKTNAPFIKVDCSTLPSTLLESELFGYEPGAFTGASRQHFGKFEQAQNGTLFLDEISNISLDTQAKLLGVLEDLKITRLGGSEVIPLNLAIVASTNKPLEDLIEKRLFRPDLFYRLNRFKLEIPPLRERIDDIPLLCRYFTEQACREYKKKISGISEAGYRKIVGHGWPGNIRELRNVIFKAVLFTKTGVIGPQNLDIAEIADSGSARPAESPVPRKRRDITRLELEKTLKRFEGNIFSVVKDLKVARGTVYNKMKKYGMNANAFRP